MFSFFDMFIGLEATAYVFSDFQNPIQFYIYIFWFFYIFGITLYCNPFVKTVFPNFIYLLAGKQVN